MSAADAGRLALWAGTDAWRAECARVRRGARTLHAEGTQLGAEPLPYRLTYEIETYEGFAAARVRVAAEGDGWSREVALTRDLDGAWSCEARHEGDAPGLDEPGCDARVLAGATDVDLGLSPMFNTFPVLRLGLLDAPGGEDISAAWISVPDLAVRRSEQRYEHVSSGVVRFSEPDFEATLTFDAEGLVVEYPDLARRAGA